MFKNFGIKKAVFLLIPTLTLLLLLPRQTNEVAASYLNGYAPNYNYSYPTATVGNGRIYQIGGLTLVSGQCVFSAQISWTANFVNRPVVTVRDPDTGMDKMFASGSSGVQSAPWIAPGKSYLFSLWDYDQQAVLSQIWINANNRSCPLVPNQNNYSYFNPGFMASDPMAPQTGSMPTSQNVSAMDNFFSPRTITIAAGGAVTWTNMGSMQHTVTADNGMFDSGTLMPGASFSQTFNTPGTYAYHCRFHGGPGGVGMSGTVVVTANSSGSGSNTINPTYNNSSGNYYNPGNSSYYSADDPLGICNMVDPTSTYAMQHCGGAVNAYSPNNTTYYSQPINNYNSSSYYNNNATNYTATQSTIPGTGDVLGICNVVAPDSPYALQHCGGYRY